MTRTRKISLFYGVPTAVVLLVVPIIAYLAYAPDHHFFDPSTGFVAAIAFVFMTASMVIDRLKRSDAPNDPVAMWFSFIAMMLLATSVCMGVIGYNWWASRTFEYWAVGLMALAETAIVVENLVKLKIF